METGQTKLVTCACIACNGHVQFEPQHAGLRVNCPYCGQEVLLCIPPEIAPAQAKPSPPPRRESPAGM